MFVTVRLIGSLGKEFTRSIPIKAKNTREVISGLCANFPGFKDYIRDKYFKIFRVKPQDAINLGEDELDIPLGDYSFVICPAVSGSGGLLRIVAGTALIGIGAIFGGALLFPLGASLILGGISQLLTPLPGSPKEQEKLDSYLASAGQGRNNLSRPVPILYGTRIVRDSPVISLNRTTQRLLG
jgi:predicted phage tail protein